MGIRSWFARGGISVLLLLGSSSSFSQPRVFVEESIHDFGDLYKGQARNHVFVIMNVGTDTLEINGLSVGCGCTAAFLASGKVAPGLTTELAVTFSSGAFGGNVMKSITFQSNDPLDSSKTLYVRANIHPVVESLPAGLHFDGVRVDSAYHQEIQLKNMTESPVTLLGAESQHLDLALKLTPKTLQPGETSSMGVDFTPRGVGIYGGSILVKTDFEAQPDVQIQVMVDAKK